jgi:MFS family permease
VTLGGCFGFGVFLTFLPLYIASLGMDAGHVGLVFAAQALANALSRIPFGRLSDRITDRVTLVIGGLLGLATALALTGYSLLLRIFPPVSTTRVYKISPSRRKLANHGHFQ